MDTKQINELKDLLKMHELRIADIENELMDLVQETKRNPEKPIKQKFDQGFLDLQYEQYCTRKIKGFLLVADNVNLVTPLPENLSKTTYENKILDIQRFMRENKDIPDIFVKALETAITKNSHLLRFGGRIEKSELRTR